MAAGNKTVDKAACNLSGLTGASVVGNITAYNLPGTEWSQDLNLV